VPGTPLRRRRPRARVLRADHPSRHPRPVPLRLPASRRIVL